eukprot:gene12345-biopygen1908
MPGKTAAGAGHTVEFEETGTVRTRAQPFLPQITASRDQVGAEYRDHALGHLGGASRRFGGVPPRALRLLHRRVLRLGSQAHHARATPAPLSCDPCVSPVWVVQKLQTWSFLSSEN